MRYLQRRGFRRILAITDSLTGVVPTEEGR
jgi:hypothetical protein